MIKTIAKISVIILITIFSCSKEDEVKIKDFGLSPSSNADRGSSYTVNKKTNILIDYASLPFPANSGDLRDAISYLDANGDGLTDVFMATGQFLSTGEVNSILAINDGQGGFTSSTIEFNGKMPPATHARKTISGDFNGDKLRDIFVFDTGIDTNPFPGSNPKLIIQNSVGSFTWTKLLDQTGFHHGGASADIDNDGDIDIFVGGFEPFFYINDGNGNFTMVEDRFDRSIQKIFTVELIDVDKDGFVDLLVGAHEQEGDDTSIYWGNATGNYSGNLRTIIPALNNYGTVLDFDAEDIDGDGDRDIVVNRTGGGNNNFYIGRRVQLVINNGGRTFSDLTSQIDNPGLDTEGWMRWLRIQDSDGDGDLDIFSDNLSDGFKLLNDGKGNFTRM